MTTFIQLLIGGIALGAIYGVVAMGFVVIFKSTGVFNFAQGDLLMIGAYLCFGIVATAAMPFWAAVIVTLLLAALLGAILQWVVLKPMQGGSLFTMVMVTLALSMILRALVFFAWGPDDYALPDGLPSGTLVFGDLRISIVDLIIMAVAGFAILAFSLFFRFTPWGLQMRATADNPEGGAAVGISTNRIFTLALVIGTVTAAMGGILLANLQIVSLRLSDIGLLAFPAAVIGGMRSIPGAVVGGVIIGIVSQLVTGYLGGQVATAITYGVLLLVLLIKPHGIFGKSEAVRA